MANKLKAAYSVGDPAIVDYVNPAIPRGTAVEIAEVSRSRNGYSYRVEWQSPNRGQVSAWFHNDFDLLPFGIPSLD